MLARQALGITWKYVDTLEDELQRMIDQEITRSQAAITLRKVFRFDQAPGSVSDRTERNQNERIDNVLHLWTSSPTLDGFHSSRYGLYQAVTEWADHISPVSGTGSAAVQRAERIVKGGEMQRIKNDTFRLLSV